MDKKKGLLNISISIASKIILFTVSIIVRRFLIINIGNDVNGLNSLYTNIIGVLSVAELGIGSAIAFSMYRPIVANDKEKITALYCLYRKKYQIVGVVIFFTGLLIMPFLPSLIGDYEEIRVNVYLAFFLTLISIDLIYFFSAKTSLIEAYKDNYITTCILTIAKLVRYGLQIITIIIWKSYMVFLACQIVETVLIWLMTELIIQKKHGDIIAIQEMHCYYELIN